MAMTIQDQIDRLHELADIAPLGYQTPVVIESREEEDYYDTVIFELQPVVPYGFGYKVLNEGNTEQVVRVV